MPDFIPSTEYREEPRLSTLENYKDGIETHMAVISYRNLCRHIEKTILEPQNYGISYAIEKNQLVAFLDSSLQKTRVKVHVDNIFTHLNGRFETVLEGLEDWNDDCLKIARVQNALASKPESISRPYGGINSEREFLSYTGHFWGSDNTCSLLNDFIWSKPSVSHQYITSPHNISLLLIMPIAITKFLMITKKEQIEKNERRGRDPLHQHKLRRAENKCGYQSNEIIDTRIFRSCTKSHPWYFRGAAGQRFRKYPYLLQIDQDKFFSGKLIHTFTYGYEKEVVLEPAVCIQVGQMNQKLDSYANITYTQVPMTVHIKPKLTIPNDSPIDRNAMALFSESTSDTPQSLSKEQPVENLNQGSTSDTPQSLSKEQPVENLNQDNSSNRIKREHQLESFLTSLKMLTEKEAEFEALVSQMRLKKKEPVHDVKPNQLTKYSLKIQNYLAAKQHMEKIRSSLQKLGDDYIEGKLPLSDFKSRASLCICDPEARKILDTHRNPIVADFVALLKNILAILALFIPLIVNKGFFNRSPTKSSQMLDNLENKVSILKS